MANWTVHTPGPWTHYDDSKQSVHRHQIVALGKTVAHIYCTKGCEEADAANAKLIAAAPTMFVYIAMRARDGDERAVQILEGLRP